MKTHKLRTKRKVVVKSRNIRKNISGSKLLIGQPVVVPTE